MEKKATLILETSTPSASLAIAGVDGSVVQYGFASDRSHNALLFGPLEELLEEARGREIGLVLVGSGPGSYSGTRVGIAAAQGVAIALGCPAVAVPSLLAVPAAEGGAGCLVIGDARRGSYWAVRVEGLRMERPPELMDAEELAARAAAAVAAGEAVVSFEEPGRFPLAAEFSAVVRQEFPTADRLWRAWLASPEGVRAGWLADAPQPIYLKPPHITEAKRPWLAPGRSSAAKG